MVTTSDAALMNGGMMVETGAMGPTTVMGQILGALNTGIAEDMSLNIETLECSNGFDCNVDEVRINCDFLLACHDDQILLQTTLHSINLHIKEVSSFQIKLVVY